MASENMVEDQSESSLPNIVLHTGAKNDQFTSGDEYAPKVRKPYTITKQRERWTEEEHKKFLEALKLYGRAWRRIEEHVGTKTAVQIRSHAQKFFSKVVRESSSGDATEVKPIEIPAPRPKRKPKHPYPRKMTTPVKTGAAHLLEQRPRSTSPNSSGSDQENQSPTSVLSAVGSDTFAMTDLFSPNGCSSPVSSAAGVKPISEPDFSPDENENGFSSRLEENDCSTPNEKLPVKLELSWEDKVFVKEGSSEAASSTQSLKLFGKTVLVTDSHRPSSPTSGTCKSLLPDKNVIPTNFSQSHTDFAWSNLPCAAPVYYMQFLSKNSENSVAAASCSTTPWCSLYGGLSLPYPFLQPHNPFPVKEGGSERNCNFSERNCDFDTQSGQVDDNEQKKTFLFRPSEGSAFSQPRGNKDKCIKGFVPYKRCLAERDAHSSMVTSEEREEQRIRLCL